MKQDYAQDNVYWLLIQIAFRVKHGLILLAEKHDLTAPQLHTLGIMKPGEAIPMNTISCILQCDASNVTGIVDRLLMHGYIERTENPKDRRVKMISLTPAGEELRKTLFDEMADYELPEFKQLAEEQRAELKTILSQIMNASQPQK